MTTSNGASTSSTTSRDDGGRYSIAYLGPDGTYGQQAARQFVATHPDLRIHEQELEWIPCTTITDAYTAVADYTVLPLENTIFGSVTETLDCFFTSLDNPSCASTSISNSNPNITSPSDRKGKGREKTIIANLDLPIQHCLVVRKGTRMEDIQWVRSHEQALGQSSAFLGRYLPRAKRISTASTALAAQSLLLDRGEEGKGAALCSRSVVELQPDTLEVLYEGTQDRKDNHTRFLLLTSLRDDTLDRLGLQGATPGSTTKEPRPRSRFYILPSPNLIPSVIRTPGDIIASIHSRPIIPVNVEDGRKYPCGVFLEISTQGPIESIDESDGIICLGTAGGI